MSRFESWLRRHLPLKELGWKEVGEQFTRFIVFKCRGFAVYIHKLDAPVRPPKCHDHPWHFWAILLAGGYWEEMNGETVWRRAPRVLYRTARTIHNTVTRPGHPNWSIIVVSRRVRPWAMTSCDSEGHWLLEKN